MQGRGAGSHARHNPRNLVLIQINPTAGQQENLRVIAGRQQIRILRNTDNDCDIPHRD